MQWRLLAWVPALHGWGRLTAILRSYESTLVETCQCLSRRWGTDSQLRKSPFRWQHAVLFQSAVLFKIAVRSVWARCIGCGRGTETETDGQTERECVFVFLLHYFTIILLSSLCVLRYFTIILLSSFLWREAGDVWRLPPVGDLRDVIWFHFTVSFLVFLPSPVTLSV